MDGILPFVSKWMELKSIMTSETSHVKEGHSVLLRSREDCQNFHLIAAESRMSGDYWMLGEVTGKGWLVGTM